MAHELRVDRRQGLAGERSRRVALAALAAGTAGSLATSALLPATAKKRKKKKKKKSASLPKVTYKELSLPLESTGVVNLIVPCPEGTVPISGGAFVEGVDVDALIETRPVLSGQLGWTVAARITDDPNPGAALTVIAVCLEAVQAV